MSARSLAELAVRYFKRMGYTVKRDVELEGFSGLLQTFDLLIARAEERHVASIMDWRRTVGVNMIINVDRASADVDMRNPIVIATKFSDHAKAYSHRRNITLLTKREILTQLGESR